MRTIWHRRLPCLDLAAVATAIAATFGPFHVTALGSPYAQTTYDTDSLGEYPAAQKIASIYLAPLLNTPGKNRGKERACSNRPVTIETGYWGASYPDTGDWGKVVINVAWVNTGPIIMAADSCK